MYPEMIRAYMQENWGEADTKTAITAKTEGTSPLPGMLILKYLVPAENACDNVFN